MSKSIPSSVQSRFDYITRLTDTFCQAHLNDEYRLLCRELAGVLARKRPSPLLRGKSEVWACAIVRVIGWVNFLDDKSQQPHMKLTAIDKVFGVGESTAQAKAKSIRDMLKICPLDPAWSLGSRIEDNPMAWMIQVNGFLLDARFLRKEVQEEAFRQGLIPYVPDKRPSGSFSIVSVSQPHGVNNGEIENRPTTQDVGDHQGDGRNASPQAGQRAIQ